MQVTYDQCHISIDTPTTHLLLITVYLSGTELSLRLPRDSVGLFPELLASFEGDAMMMMDGWMVTTSDDDNRLR